MKPRTLQLTNPLMHGPDVEHAQQLLANKGYLPASAATYDGVFGPQSAQACVTAKRALGYPDNQLYPTCGPKLLAYLDGTAKPPASYQARAAIRAAQHAKNGPPFKLGWPIGRIDAGVDNSRPFYAPITAIGDCVVTKIDPVGGGSWGGLGAIWFDLNEKIVSNGRPYLGWYTAESGHIEPGLSVGSHVKLGQPVVFTKSGWQETGFIPSPAYLRAHPDHWNSQTPTEPGRDFYDFVLQQLQKKAAA